MQAGDDGPRGELERWKARAAWLGRLAEQSKSPDCRVVAALGAAARLAAHKAWKEAEARVRAVPVHATLICTMRALCAMHASL
jgi:hypothetical protein